MIIRDSDRSDLDAITTIYNEAIATTTATFDTEPKTEAEQLEWFEAHADRYPILVAELDGDVVGWSSISPWSGRCAYADTAETSFYVRSDHRGEGIGRALKSATIEHRTDRRRGRSQPAPECGPGVRACRHASRSRQEVRQSVGRTPLSVAARLNAEERLDETFPATTLCKSHCRRVRHDNCPLGMRNDGATGSRRTRGRHGYTGAMPRHPTGDMHPGLPARLRHGGECWDDGATDVRQRLLRLQQRRRHCIHGRDLSGVIRIQQLRRLTV